MGKEILIFGDIEIEKINFTIIKVLSFQKILVDIEILLVPNKISYCKKNYKHSIGYLHNDYKVNPSHIMLPKTSAYVKMIDKLKGCIF